MEKFEKRAEGAPSLPERAPDTQADLAKDTGESLSGIMAQPLNAEGGVDMLSFGEAVRGTSRYISIQQIKERYPDILVIDDISSLSVAEINTLAKRLERYEGPVVIENAGALIIKAAEAKAEEAETRMERTCLKKIGVTGLGASLAHAMMVGHTRWHLDSTLIDPSIAEHTFKIEAPKYELENYSYLKYEPKGNLIDPKPERVLPGQGKHHNSDRVTPNKKAKRKAQKAARRKNRRK